MIHTPWDWAIQHPTTVSVGAFWIFSNAVSAMPTPRETSSNLYHWAFDFFHGLAGNLGRIMASRYPNLINNLPVNGKKEQ